VLQGMPRRISDYPDAFAGWNLISSFGSIISVVATWLFLYIVYVQLVEGKAASRYPWLTPQFYSDSLQTLLNRSYNSLEWALSSPPKPHAFVSLPLQSGLPELLGIISDINYWLPALEGLIEQFHTLVANSDINVITEANGDMSIEVPADMPKEEANYLRKRVGVIDRLINTKGSDIHTLFEQAEAEQTKLKALNTKDIPQISKQMQAFIDLNKSYKN